jgi:uncharacterized protein (TIGR02284 family)
MNKEKAIGVLNTLLEINNDRIKGYETASKETDEADLKTLFSQFTQTSQRCKTELVSEIKKLGGEPVEGTKTTGKFYRAWMDVKAALTGKDRKTILSSCEYGEDVAVDTYENEIKSHMEYLSNEQQNLIKSQSSSIKADHNKVRSLRDSLVLHK